MAGAQNQANGNSLCDCIKRKRTFRKRYYNRRHRAHRASLMRSFVKVREPGRTPCIAAGEYLTAALTASKGSVQPPQVPRAAQLARIGRQSRELPYLARA